CGINQCSSDSDCKITPPTHKICAMNRCILTQGEGDDECRNDTDCLAIQKYSCDPNQGVCYADDVAGTYIGQEGLLKCQKECKITPSTTTTTTTL
ncbi:MAG: hypothetical protein ACP5OX_02615, partial [Minisyncoccia bacterium]